MKFVSFSNDTYNSKYDLTFFFCGSRDSNPGPCIFYVLSLSTELRSRGQHDLILIFDHYFSTLYSQKNLNEIN